ncbi:hypothetical protein AAFF_G00056890 [Aldrovandia affinis]|uniref:Uncharacterized protein n=1 Tax=Aldrovandia affinis TaxID=143900 RepID=A0AAD7S0I4_9TELE|nr:hypothetical protein AAFF_G00056890 [Aldrovandia affinis]
MCHLAPVPVPLGEGSQRRACDRGSPAIRGGISADHAPRMPILCIAISFERPDNTRGGDRGATASANTPLGPNARSLALLLAVTVPRQTGGGPHTTPCWSSVYP